jgi:hypothetical protein
MSILKITPSVKALLLNELMNVQQMDSSILGKITGNMLILSNISSSSLINLPWIITNSLLFFKGVLTCYTVSINTINSDGTIKEYNPNPELKTYVNKAVQLETNLNLLNDTNVIYPFKNNGFGEKNIVQIINESYNINEIIDDSSIKYKIIMVGANINYTIDDDAKKYKNPIFCDEEEEIVLSEF